MDDQDVRMIERACGLCLLLKPNQTIFVGRKRGRQNLDRHFPIHLRVIRAIDLTHPALAELRADFVASDFCAGDDSHVLSCKFVRLAVNATILAN
jgi:hypothetical protein